ncbi:replication initiation and membrane attachment family protein [Hazenella coriacea]|uniref:Replicative DNA helicase loader DnaB n=1 Tax=Hazenella coriacea TaxID=1179467 RepID=A0A4V2UVQ4_9BACL|nr:DnaD domain protein [Hazenella coriacea]TCS96717.1 replicative DNA helicase loader DnaB [Hazenella coriacea]
MTMFRKDLGWRCRTRRPIHSADLYGLTHLYQPIVGATSVALYMTLMYQAPLHRAGMSEIHRHTYLLKLCSLSFEQLVEARHLLEGVGLINTYEKKDPELGRFYEYELIPPLSPTKFFHSDVLSITLYHLLGKERYLAVRNSLFETTSEDLSIQTQTKNVTKTFKEIFGSFKPQDLTKAEELVKEIDWNKEELDDKFVEGQAPQWSDDDDLSMVRMRLGSLVEDHVWTKKLIAELKEICFLYQLNEWDLSTALLNPYVTRNGMIDLERLRSFVKSEYRLRFGGPPVVSKRQRSSERATNPSTPSPKPDQKALTEEERHFQQLAEISPIELLSYYQKGSRIPDSDIKLVESLVHHYKLPYGVINVLLEYVLLKYDYKLSRSLVEKIAGHWKRSGIKTVEDALEQARKEDWDHKNRTNSKYNPNRKYRSIKREEKLPRAVLSQIQSAPTDENLIEEKATAAEDLAEKQARIKAKLQLMNERFVSNKQEKENTT